MEEMMNGASQIPHRATAQSALDEGTYPNRCLEYDPEVVLMFRDVVRTALTYTAHLSRLFVFLGLEGDEDVPGGSY